MMPAFNGLLLSVGSSLAASIVAKVTVTTALGLITAWLTRRNRAAVRHVLLAAAFGVLLMLPVASVLAPPIHVAVPIAVEIQAAVPTLVDSATGVPPVTPGDAGVHVKPSTPHSSALSPSDLLLAGWIVGMALFLLPVMIGLGQIRSLRRSGLPWRRGQSAVETIAVDAGIHRRVEVLLHEALPGPMTCGVLHPAIVLPRDAENWNEEYLTRAIVHEVEHVRRGDSVSHCLARVACAVYWFHPLVWIAWRKLALEAERSCDDAVLRCSDGTAYADQLVGLAKRLSLVQRSPLLAMANRADLAKRVGAVLDSRQRRGRAGTFALALACVVAVGLVIGMSPLIVAAPQGQPGPAFEVASVKPSAPVPPNGGVYFGPPRGGPGTPDPGLITWSYSTLRALLMTAYDIKTYQVSGPDWLNTERYDIVAKVPPGATKEQVNVMWQKLLAERFGVVLHHESKEFQVEELVVDKGGSKLKETAWDPASPLPPGPPQRDNHGGLASPGQVNTISPRENGARVHTVAKAQPISQLTATFTNVLNRPVLDKTGLAGKYDYTLDYVIEGFAFPLAPSGQGPGPAAAPGNAGEPGPDLAAAIQQQLGLKLVRSKAMLDVIVIDKAEKMPTPN
jgi:bla regulator protein blaR1